MDAGADVNATNAQSLTPVIMAAAHGCGHCVAILVKAKAEDTQAKDKDLEHPDLGKWVKAHPSLHYWKFGAWEKVQAANLEVTAALEQEIESSKTSNKKVIIIDMTNMNPFTRELMLKHFNANFYKIALNLVSKIDNKAITFLKKNAKFRSLKLSESGKPKTINDGVIDRMVGSYVPPSKSEKYDMMIDVDNIEILMKKISVSKLDQKISETRMEKAFKNIKIKEFIELINLNNDFDKTLSYRQGFEKYYSDEKNIPQNVTRDTIREIQKKIPKVKEILWNAGYVDKENKQIEKPIDLFLKEFIPFYSEYKNLKYFYENSNNKKMSKFKHYMEIIQEKFDGVWELYEIFIEREKLNSILIYEKGEIADDDYANNSVDNIIKKINENLNPLKIITIKKELINILELVKKNIENEDDSFIFEDYKVCLMIRNKAIQKYYTFEANKETTTETEIKIETGRY